MALAMIAVAAAVRPPFTAGRTLGMGVRAKLRAVATQADAAPDADAVAAVRARAAARLAALEEAAARRDASESERTSWVDGRTYDPRLADPRKACLDRDGFIVARGFADAAECAAMRERMALLASAWDPARELVQFRTDAGQEGAQASSDYFLDSADRVHFFAEPGAVDEATGELLVPREAALNKAGHGLHAAHPGDPFWAYSTSARLRELVRALGWRDPVLPQSMYIYKQPLVGAEVTSHQDSTFLFTRPRQTCLGLWLALHDATVENGCLWARPGSHAEPLRRQFARNPAHFAPPRRADPAAPQMVFRDLASASDGDAAAAAAARAWEGALPPGAWPLPSDGLFERGFVPLEVHAGDLVAFVGTLDHLSLPNRSPLPRHTFQLHLVEGPRAGVAWSADNWLQYPAGKEFPSLC